MTTDLLVRYLLDDLPPADRAAVRAHLAASPADAARLARLRRAVNALAADDPPEPPAGLGTAAVARTAEHLVANGLFRPDPATAPRPARRRAGPWRWAPDPVFLTGRWVDAAVAAGIGVLAVGLGLGAVGKLRADSQGRACQDTLRGLHAALSGYGEAHNGRFPQVGTPAVPVAGAFAAELVRAGQWPDGPVMCPADPAADPPVGFAYTLGYRGPGGRLVGPRQADGRADGTPVAADLPPGADGPRHPGGVNVLSLGGAVRRAVPAAAGLNGDDIYHNDAGLVRAGLHPDDAALGRPPDEP